MSGICSIIDTFNKAVVNPALLLVFALGTMVFVYGVLEFMIGLNQDSQKKEEGKQHMLWGLVGLFIMVSAYAIIELIANSVGASLSCGA